MTGSLSNAKTKAGDRWWLLAIALLAFGLRMYQLGDHSLWFDETLSYWVATTDIPGFLLPYGAYTPLYYLLIGGVSFIGKSEYLLRFPSVFFSVLSVVMIERVGRRAGGPRAGRLAALLLAINPFNLWYAQDARMYAMTSFFVLLAMDGFMRGVEGRGWRRMIIGAAGAYFTHTISLFIVYVQFIWWLPRFRRQVPLFRRWFGAHAIAALPLVPWLAWHFMQPIQGLAAVAWIPTPSLFAPLWTAWNFISADTDTWTWLTSGLAVLALIIVIQGYRHTRHWRGLMIGWLVLPVLTAWVLSLRIQIYVDRYFAYSQFPLIVFLAIGLMSIRRVPIQLAVGAALAGLMLVNSLRIYIDPMFDKEDWRGAAAIVNEQWRAGDRFGIQNEESLIAWSYYDQGGDLPVPLQSEQQPGALDRLSRGADRVWLVYWSQLESNHRLTKSMPFDVFTQTDPITQQWLARHCQPPLGKWQLTGVTVLMCSGQ